MRLREGDRVRIISVQGAYTGCRGTLARSPSEVPLGPSGDPLGYYVAIDGENGRLRPFLSQELQLLRAVRTRGPRGDGSANRTAL
ncbi:MAG: hypothetical protein VX466_10985 [Myxococcota bacterium]|nr:hypothetical protein [Myxococcota bacterium]